MEKLIVAIIYTLSVAAICGVIYAGGTLLFLLRTIGER